MGAYHDSNMVNGNRMTKLCSKLKGSDPKDTIKEWVSHISYQSCTSGVASAQLSSRDSGLGLKLR